MKSSAYPHSVIDNPLIFTRKIVNGSKERYCYQIHVLHTNEKQCLPPFYNRQPPHFYKKILTLPPINRGLHTINIIYIQILRNFLPKL